MPKIIPVTRCGDITFHLDGRIDLTAHVAKALSLRPGDVINIARIEGRFCEHYLYVARRSYETTGRHSCTCHPVKNNGRYMRVFCKRLTGYVLSRTRKDATQVFPGKPPSPTALCLRVGAITQVNGLGPALPLIGLCI